MNNVEVLLIVANGALVLVTGWYAWSTARTANELRSQRLLLGLQTKIQTKSAEIAAQAALLQAAGHPAGEAPIPRLRQLHKDLQVLSQDIES